MNTPHANHFISDLRARAAAELRRMEWTQRGLWFVLQGAAVAAAGVVVAMPELTGSGGWQWTPAGIAVFFALQKLPWWQRWTGNGWKSRRARYLRFLDGRDTAAEFLAEQ